jgi:hypothetical protein
MRLALSPSRLQDFNNLLGIDELKFPYELYQYFFRTDAVKITTISAMTISADWSLIRTREPMLYSIFVLDAERYKGHVSTLAHPNHMPCCPIRLWCATIDRQCQRIRMVCYERTKQEAMERPVRRGRGSGRSSKIKKTR